MNRDGFQRLVDSWENFHPTVRHVIGLVMISIVSTLAMVVLMLISVRLYDAAAFFRIATLEGVWYLLQIIIAVVLAYSFLKAIFLLWYQRIGINSFSIIGFAPLLLLVIIRLMPTFFEVAVSYRMGRTYDAVYGDLQALCEHWDTTYGQVENISFQPQELPTGIFGEASVEIWRERNTVFFDMGGASYRYGFACALGGQEPISDGRRSRDFRYQRIEGMYYEFYLESE